jgi:site-specific recombinase XerC
MTSLAIVSPAIPANDADQTVGIPPALAYLSKLGTEKSRRSQREALEVLTGILAPERDLESLPWHRLTYAHVQAVRAQLEARYAPSTCNRILAALRGVLREAFQLGRTTGENLARCLSVPGVKGSRLPAGRMVERHELARIFSKAGEKPKDVRDGAILALLFGTGLRRSEVASLNREDYQEDGSLKVLGKGNKERMVYVTNEAKDLLQAWLAIRGQEEGPMFYPIGKSGKMAPRRMTDQAIYLLLQDRGKAANLDRLSPHDARRTFISNAIDASKDLTAVQALAGHASVTTTQRYDRRGEQAKAKVARLIHLPV